MKKPEYFTVNEVCQNSDEFIHLGIISAYNEQELREKLILAVSEHFDTIEEYIESTGESDAIFDSPYNQTLEFTIDGSIGNIVLRKTWIY